MRGQSSPEVGRVTFEDSPDGITWNFLGDGTRISGGWELTGLSFPFNENHYIRARGYNASVSLFESIRIFYLSTVINVAPLSLLFSYEAGGAIPEAQPLSVTSEDFGITFTATASTTGGGNWLSVTPGSGATPASLSVSVNPAGLTPGTYTGSITIESPAASNGPQVAPVELTVTEPVSFDDVPQGYWARDHILAIYDAGITGGCSTNPLRFCPDNTLTRGQMAVFVETSLGVALNSLPVCSETVFNDVNLATVGDVFCRFIEDFAARGITGGCGGGNYCPNDPVTRQQMAIFLEAALQRIPDQLPLSCSGTFSDVSSGTEQEQFVCRIIEDFAVQGITGGCGTGIFCPNAPVTRAQMAVFLVAAPPPLSP
jgi:hypothetical protein